MVTPDMMIARAPIQQPAPTVTGAPTVTPARFRGSVVSCELVVMKTCWARAQSVPIAMQALELSSQHPALMKVPLPTTRSRLSMNTPGLIEQRSKRMPNLRQRRHLSALGNKL